MPKKKKKSNHVLVQAGHDFLFVLFTLGRASEQYEVQSELARPGPA